MEIFNIFFKLILELLKFIIELLNVSKLICLLAVVAHILRASALGGGASGGAYHSASRTPPRAPRRAA